MVNHNSRPVRPIGQPTRGKTALNRLRQIDAYIALRFESMLSGGTPLILDVGYGAYPWTAIEMLDRMRRINPHMRLLGLEIDPARVATAAPYADPPALDFRLGGFNVRDVLDNALNGERARLIRCYNVLRQYEESVVADALRQLAEGLTPGGILIEGTSTPSGRLVAFDVYRHAPDELRHVALVFGTNFRAPVEALDFQPILPKRLIHHMLDPIPAAFFAAWQREWVLRRIPGHEAPRRNTWIEVTTSLANAYPIEQRRSLIRRGYVELRSALN
ncbi:MAG: class I SAM-dependent methyltransferase [Aggregatilineales bacterium]